MSSTILPAPPEEAIDEIEMPAWGALADLMIPQRVMTTRNDAFHSLEKVGARIFLEIDGRASIQNIMWATGIGRHRVLREVAALAYAGLITFHPAF